MEPSIVIDGDAIERVRDIEDVCASMEPSIVIDGDGTALTFESTIDGVLQWSRRS